MREQSEREQWGCKVVLTNGEIHFHKNCRADVSYSGALLIMLVATYSCDGVEMYAPGTWHRAAVVFVGDEP